MTLSFWGCLKEFGDGSSEWRREGAPQVAPPVSSRQYTYSIEYSGVIIIIYRIIIIIIRK